MNKTVLAIGIIFLLIGVSVVSSMKTVEKKYITEEKLSRSKFAYGCSAFSPYHIVKFPLDDPGNMEIIADGDNSYFLAGGTWSCDGIWYGCEYNSGGLWTIDPETGDMKNIGGGGTNCYDLSFDPINDRLYAAGSNALYEYDPETGEQEYIGGFGVNNTIVGIAINSEGVCYAWDIQFSSPSILYTVDLETCEATEVGTLSMSGVCGHFDYDTDLLYMSGGSLIECDVDTLECTLVGYFNDEINCLAIPYNCSYLSPITDISFDPPDPDGENGWYVSNVTATLNATDNDGVDATYYSINSGEWNIYSSPFIISEEGNDILVEYYSIDTLGFVEDVKSACIDIDKTPPNITVEWEVEKIGWRKWWITFTIICYDVTSGMDRLEIFLNEGLQSVVSGSGPTYGWSWIYFGPFSFKFIAYDVAGYYAVAVVNDTDISYNNFINDIFPQQYPNQFILKSLERFLFQERFPLLQKLLL